MSELRVALTFDAEHPSRRQCPPGAAAAIIDSLNASDVKATFFVQGRWATAYPELAVSITQNGHMIGNHSNSHAPMPDLSDRGLIADIEEAESSIRRVTGIDPRPWFRCPFGAGADDRRVLRAIKTCGYQNVHWDVAVDDWEDLRTPDEVEKGVVDGVLKKGDRAIVLLHSWPAPTAAALPVIVQRLRGANARFVTIDEVVDGR